MTSDVETGHGRRIVAEKERVARREEEEEGKA